jgi:hypothetical protein
MVAYQQTGVDAMNRVAVGMSARQSFSDLGARCCEVRFTSMSRHREFDPYVRRVPVRRRPITLPATAPTTISTRAMDIATRIEMIEASKARPSQTAEANQMFSIAHSFRPQRPIVVSVKGGTINPPRGGL